jgi:hypothetical protein
MTKERKNQKRSQIQMAKGSARRAHFANGGTLAQWRGSARTFVDRKKKMNKSACRQRIQQ